MAASRSPILHVLALTSRRLGRESRVQSPSPSGAKMSEGRLFHYFLVQIRAQISVRYTSTLLQQVSASKNTLHPSWNSGPTASFVWCFMATYHLGRVSVNLKQLIVPIGHCVCVCSFCLLYRTTKPQAPFQVPAKWEPDSASMGSQ